MGVIKCLNGSPDIFKPKKCGLPKFKVGDTVRITRKGPKKYRNIQATVEDVNLYYTDDSSVNGYKLFIFDSYLLWPERLLRKVK